MRRPSAQTVALRDQIVATLRDRGAPITTDQVAILARPTGQCAAGSECVYAFRDQIPCTGHCWKPKIYNSLRALEKNGVVERHRLPEMRDAYWSAAGEPTDAEMNKLIDAMERTL